MQTMQISRVPVYFFRRLDGGLLLEFVFGSDAITERIRPGTERTVSELFL